MQRGNFKSTSTSIGVRAQLTTLSTIMKSVDPKLHEHLGTVTGAQRKQYLHFALRSDKILFMQKILMEGNTYLPSEC